MFQLGSHRRFRLDVPYPGCPVLAGDEQARAVRAPAHVSDRGLEDAIDGPVQQRLIADARDETELARRSGCHEECLQCDGKAGPRLRGRDTETEGPEGIRELPRIEDNAFD